MSEQKKKIAIVGCGPALGLHVARRFAKEGFEIGMISNMPDQLQEFVTELKDMRVNAYAYPADVTDRNALLNALTAMREEMGPIDVVEYSPLAPMFELVDVIDLTVENTQPYIDQQLYGALTVINFFLPEMLERKDGSILVTTGATAHMPMASHANGAISQIALRHYLNMLHERVINNGVYVGSICIGAPKDDVFLANKYWEMHSEKDGFEFLYGNLKPTEAYQFYVNRGYGPAYPPMFTKEPPVPQTEEERDRLVLALYDAHVCSSILDEVIAEGEGEKSRAFIEPLVKKYGGDLSKPYFGSKGE